MKYCDYKCKQIQFNENQPICHTFDVIYCKKYKIERNKGALCLDYNKEFQKIWKRKNK